MLNGLAFVALGVIFTGAFGPRISLRTIALLVSAMALSIGILEFAIARTLRLHRRLVDGRLVGMAGAISIGFVVWLLALVFGLIRLEPGAPSDFIWFGSYFGFTAISMFVLAVRLHELGPSGRWKVSPSLNPADIRRQQRIDRDNPADPFARCQNRKVDSLDDLSSEFNKMLAELPRRTGTYRPSDHRAGEPRRWPRQTSWQTSRLDDSGETEGRPPGSKNTPKD